MVTSILSSIKKVLGLTEEYTAFDEDIIMHTNTVFASLNQLGIGPSDGFYIIDKTTTWDAFISDVRLNSVKTYVYLRVRLLFDPPTNSFLMAAMQEQIKELEWRILAYQETPIFNNDDFETVLDGGTSTIP